MESRDELLQALHKVEAWERDQKDLWFWEKLGRLPFVLLDKLTPKFLQDKMGQALDELIGYIETGGRYLIQESAVTKRFVPKVGRSDITLDQVSGLPIAMMDQVSDEFAKSRSKFATWQGATTGVGGIFTLAIDIPLLLGLSLKVLQEISLSYGYDPQDKNERVFMIKCLQFTSSDFVGKKAILESIDSTNRQQTFSQLQGWREVLLLQTENFGWKKLFQLIPIAGILFGAYLNKKSIDDLAETARMLYRKRRILERLEQPVIDDAESNPIS
ncbi:EcsC family protein [Tumebacillus permanentifrigoris]|uniref:EcsC family protein n=1 Tax=Tumebacillus permanentifrigoris TaxID=378543 RepID=A0A316DB60_9BACL|nr:EcsC family protein [Tumebacillus permanentifrigoris]PWK14968.1 EcsC family protein [Tumebacillus permanentifrigoris]